MAALQICMAVQRAIAGSKAEQTKSKSIAAAGWRPDFGSRLNSREASTSQQVANRHGFANSGSLKLGRSQIRSDRAMNPEACVETTCCSVSGHGKLLLPNRRASTARYLVELTPDLRGRGLLCGSENSLRRAADLEFVDVHIAG